MHCLAGTWFRAGHRVSQIKVSKEMSKHMNYISITARTGHVQFATCVFYMHPKVFVNQFLISYQLSGYGHQLPPVTQLPNRKMTHGSNWLKPHQTFNWRTILTYACSFKKLKSCHCQYPIFKWTWCKQLMCHRGSWPWTCEPYKESDTKDYNRKKGSLNNYVFQKQFQRPACTGLHRLSSNTGLTGRHLIVTIFCA